MLDVREDGRLIQERVSAGSGPDGRAPVRDAARSGAPDGRGGATPATPAGPVRRLWEGWKRIARRIGDVQARVLMTLFYFLCLAPFGLAVRWGTDPLAIKPGHPRGWRSRSAEAGPELDRARRQF
jgi:hypothetical protein